MHGQAVQLAGKADGEIGHVDHLLHFALAFGEDLTHFESDERAEVGFRTAQLVAQFAHDFAALRRGNHTPFEERRGGARAMRS